MTLRLDVQYACDNAHAPDADRFSQWAAAALRGLAHDAELTIRIVDENESANLNTTYANRPGPTNVLSFPFEAPAGVDIPLLGDIVICAPVVRREAKEQGKQPNAHWAHMTVHGTLHLLGFDHRNDEEAKQMEALETAILTKLRFPDPYAVSGPP